MNTETERENDDLWADLTKCVAVRNLALEEAASDIQPGPDGQDYLDRAEMIRRWVAAAYERYDAGERAWQGTVNAAGVDVLNG